VRLRSAWALRQFGKTIPDWVAEIRDGRIAIRQLNPAPEAYVETQVEGLNLEMVQIPAGSFEMGSPDEENGSDDERPQHPVTIAQPFWMGKYPVTQAQWRAVAALPQINRELNPDPSSFKGDNRPVERVSWYDAQEFCDRLFAHTQRPYRLPSEAEWEYACRAETKTPYHFGKIITPNLANFGKSRIEETTPVDYFAAANPFGLHDMHGNVWEWCADHGHGNYDGAPTDGSAWLTDKGFFRLLRGGSWHNNSGICRSAIRSSNNPDLRNNFIGFRVVCSSA
jgi:formylglycine-generating enzyme required for sulfatase activity